MSTNEIDELEEQLRKVEDERDELISRMRRAVKPFPHKDENDPPAWYCPGILANFGVPGYLGNPVMWLIQRIAQARPDARATVFATSPHKAHVEWVTPSGALEWIVSHSELRWPAVHVRCYWADFNEPLQAKTFFVASSLVQQTLARLSRQDQNP